jgi:hypothetical protein
MLSTPALRPTPKPFFQPLTIETEQPRNCTCPIGLALMIASLMAVFNG